MKKERRQSMDKKVLKKLTKLAEEYPEEFATALLEGYFWIPSLETAKIYERMEDDTSGILTVTFSADGDAWINVFSKVDPAEFRDTFRFRVPFAGGGQSPRVRNALLVLAEAIRLDNKEHPQFARKSSVQ